MLAFDTSNYHDAPSPPLTAREARNEVASARRCARARSVCGQSDALFSHVKRLPELDRQAVFGYRHGRSFPKQSVSSTRPRAVEGSYMPCFLAGESQAQVLARRWACPFMPFSHQQGHIAASLWCSGHMELMDKPHLGLASFRRYDGAAAASTPEGRKRARREASAARRTSPPVSSSTGRASCWACRFRPASSSTP